MDKFNMNVLKVAVLLFIVLLGLAGIVLYFSIRNAHFPPFDTVCPTYFKITKDGERCEFDENLYGNSDYPSLASNPQHGSGSCYPVYIKNFYPPGASRSEIACIKNRWSRNCGVFWDGISNNNSACLDNESIINFN